MKFHLRKILYFEAAHRNPLGDERQQRLHGHSYRVDLLADGAPDAGIGWVVDFAEMKSRLKPLVETLDHACLNEVPGLESDTRVPAIEAWLHERLLPAPGWFAGVRVCIDGDCCFNPAPMPADEFEGLPERWRFTFEAAQSLPSLPEGHACRCVHGHSYICEAGAKDLDALASLLPALYEALDHRYLNDLEGLEKSTVEHIAHWIWRWIERHGQRPTAVVVQETYTARCIYLGEQ